MKRCHFATGIDFNIGDSDDLLPAMGVIACNEEGGSRRIATINSIDLWIHYFRQYILSSPVPYKPVIKVCHSYVQFVYQLTYGSKFVLLTISEEHFIAWLSNGWKAMSKISIKLEHYAFYNCEKLECACKNSRERPWFICRVIRALRMVTFDMKSEPRPLITIKFEYISFRCYGSLVLLFFSYNFNIDSLRKVIDHIYTLFL